MSLSFCDTTPYGVIMGSDSKSSEIIEGDFTTPVTQFENETKVCKINLNDFYGLLGYVGTEKVGNVETLNWIKQFIEKEGKVTFDQFIKKISETLSHIWTEEKLSTGLIIHIGGYYKQTPPKKSFWHISNVELNSDGKYRNISNNFHLQENPNVKAGIDMHFHNGTIAPYNIALAYLSKLETDLEIAGCLTPKKNIGDYMNTALQRIEFTKRYFQSKKGARAGTDYADKISGAVTLYAVDPNGNFFKMAKNNNLN